MTLFRGTGLLAALSLLGLAAFINYQSLAESYGSGPPYFGRTTNMDKWSDPLPGLVMLDGLVLLIVAAAVVMFLRRQRELAALESVPDPGAISDPGTDADAPIQ
ncbi:MAG: hypothetical protein JNM83_00485 [Myxococcales bacterium]|jgi:multisubunit Na+/H+ antiporter MnhC subunit|nr:hypothetical protein [Myxococcales bacterium]